MDQKFLSSRVYESGVLSMEEMLSVFHVKHAPSPLNVCKFSRKPRYFLRNGVKSSDDNNMTQDFAEYLDWLEELTIGKECQVIWNNVWWNAVIIAHNPITNRLKIHYPGWDAHWEQWIFRYSGIFRPPGYCGPTAVPDQYLTEQQIALKQQAQANPYLQE
ncbi:hypothetical protein RFI_02608 [Reticulomyxa filosa]|uniref:Uncharacterized protein n=1 Tax=Reticulomyxa filosa TaxID=46433 RepID=X6P8G7_RETFI|nr:hypothetical protein RFI_02608 [Reticulomyxa filosa]|eukprot:ETO34486.1 hypothetical protein RFI_02608 [Reticulomyxa filosa]